MSLIKRWTMIWRKHSLFHYRLKIVGNVCELKLYGLWELNQAPLVIEQAMVKLAGLDWQTLNVDCRRVKPYDKTVLDTAFIATMIRLVQIASKRASGKGIDPDWSFVFRAREQTKVLELAGLSHQFAGRISYEQSRLGFRSQVLLLPSTLSATTLDADNTS